MDAGDGTIEYDPQSHAIVVSNRVYARLRTPDEEIKLSLAGAIGEALVTRPILGIPVPRFLKAQLYAGLFPLSGKLRFARAFVVPISLLRKCRHDGMSPAKIREYFDVTDDLINERVAML